MFNHEPFAEKTETAESTGRPRYHMGYRLVATREIVASLEIPAETVERAVLSKLLLISRLRPDGTVVPDIAPQNEFSSEIDLAVTEMMIDQLITKAIDGDNLCIEETNIAELHTLLAALERSISLVKRAINKVDGPT